MKKALKFLLWAMGIGAVLFIVLLVVALNSSFQTWAVNKALSGDPARAIAIDSVSAGFSEADIQGVSYAENGMKVTVGSVKASYSLWGMIADSSHVAVDSVSVSGIEADLSAMTPPPADAAKAAEPASAESKPFGGVLAITRDLGKRFTLGKVAIDGQVKLAGNRSASFNLSGGGIKPGTTGELTLVAFFKDDNIKAPVSSVGTPGTKIRLAQLAEGGFSSISVAVPVTAEGDAVKGVVGLQAQADLSAIQGGERWDFSLVQGERKVVVARNQFDAATGGVSGSYELSVDNAVATPFAFGFPLPPFMLSGKGEYKVPTRGAGEIVFGGGTDLVVTDLPAVEALLRKLDVDPDVVATSRQTLRELGELHVRTTQDLNVKGTKVSVDKVSFRISGRGDQPLVLVANATPFTIQDGAFAGADPDKLATVELTRIPLALVAPFAKGMQLKGGAIDGAWQVGARDGVISVKPVRTFSVGPVTLAQVEGTAVKPLLDRVTVSADASVSFTSAVAAKAGAAARDAMVRGSLSKLSVADVSGKGARLSANFEANLGTKAVKADFRGELDLSELALQPVAAASGPLLDNGVGAAFGGSFSLDDKGVATLAPTTLSMTVRGVPLLDAKVSAAVELPAGTKPLRVRESAAGLTVDLPGIARQPVLAGKLRPLLRGNLACAFDARHDAAGVLAFNGDVKLLNLLVRGESRAMPELVLTPRGTLDANGNVKLSVPLLATGEARSDLLADVLLQPAAVAGKPLAFDVKVTGRQLVVDDLQRFSALAPEAPSSAVERPAPEAPVSREPDVRAPWADVAGKVDVRLDSVKLKSGDALSKFVLRAHLDASTFTVDEMGGMLGADRFDGSVKLDFKPGAMPWTLAAKLKVPTFDTGAYLQKLDPSKLPIIETRFAIDVDANSKAPNLGLLGEGLGGKFSLASTGGRLRPLAARDTKSEALQTGIGVVGGILSAIDSKKTAKVASSLTTVDEIMKELEVVDFGEALVNASRGADKNIRLDSLLISAKDLVVRSSGVVTHKDGVPVMQQAIDFPVELWVNPQSKLAQRLNKAGLVTNEKDAKGFHKSVVYQMKGTLMDRSDNLSDIILSALGKMATGEKANLSPAAPAGTPTPAPVATPIPPAAPVTPTPAAPTTPTAPKSGKEQRKEAILDVLPGILGGGTAPAAPATAPAQATPSQPAPAEQPKSGKEQRKEALINALPGLFGK